MAVSLTGPLGAGIESLETMLSESSTFQTWTDSDNATEALAFISIISSSNQFTSFPHVYLDYSDDFEWAADSESSKLDYPPGPSGGFIVRFIDTPDTDLSEQDQKKQFLKDMIGVIHDLEGEFGKGGELAIGRIAPVERLQVQRKEQGKMSADGDPIEIMWRDWNFTLAT